MNQLDKSLLAALLLLFSAVLPAQEADDEREADELREEIRIVQLETRHLTESLANAQARLKLLKEAQELSQSVESLEQQLEKAESLDNDAAIEKLEAQLEDHLLNMEEIFGRIELLHQGNELLTLETELEEAELPELLSEAQSLQKTLTKRGKLTAELFKTYRQGPETKEAELEEELEVLGEKFEINMETVFLKLELHWAREEEDAEAIEELERELKELMQE